MTGRRLHLGRAALTAVPLGFVALFFLWPVGAILGRGLAPAGALDFGPLGDVFTDPALRHVVWFTLVQATWSTLLAFLLGLPAAIVLGRYRFRGKTLLAAIVTVPFALPTVVVATAFSSLGLERSTVAIVVANAFFNIAVVARVVGTAIEQLDPREVEAARMLGASPVPAIRTVVLPAVRPALVAAASVVFLFCFTSFGIVLVLGGPGFATIETEIYRRTVSFLDLPAAAALAIVQVVTVGLVLAVAARAGRSRARIGGAPGARRLAGHARLGALVAVAPALALIAVPIVELVRRALADGAYGLRHLGTVPTGASASPLTALGTSLRIAAVATVIAVTLGLMLGTALTRDRRGSRVARLTEGLVLVPLGVSAVTVGFGFLIVFDEPPLDLRTSWWIIPIAHALVALPFVVRTVTPLLRAVDPHAREAAAVLGAPPARVWWTVDGPVVARAAAVAATFAAAISLGEFGATLFIVRPETTTMPVAIYQLLGRPGATNQSTAMAIAVILMLTTAALAALSERVRIRSAR